MRDCLILACIACTPAATLANVSFQWAQVGNAGNAADPTTGYGAVASPYRISKYEVTNNQYVEFLNAKASVSDPFGLYNVNMTSSTLGGISRSGASTFTYAAKGGYENQPVVFVSWYDSIRFINWLHNGQGSGDTESGVYQLLGGTTVPSNAGTITRSAGAKFFMPNENEWYKAAYHQPAAAGGDVDSYWLYPTRTNTTANSDQPPGDAAILNNAANFKQSDSLANGYNDGYAVTGSTTFSTSIDYLTDVGAYTGAPSFYGTFDQGGNAREWSEALSSGPFHSLLWGGSWDQDVTLLRSNVHGAFDRPGEINTVGFRVATVPEPAGEMVLMSVGGMFLCKRSRDSRAKASRL